MVPACLSALSLPLPLTAFPFLPFLLSECLEGQFYSYAAHGHPLRLLNHGPKPIGGEKAVLSPKAQALAEGIAKDETAHVNLIFAALGSQGFSCPLVDIGPAFTAVLLGALNVTSLPVAFSPSVPTPSHSLPPHPHP